MASGPDLKAWLWGQGEQARQGTGQCSGGGGWPGWGVAGQPLGLVSP